MTLLEDILNKAKVGIAFDDFADPKEIKIVKP